MMELVAESRQYVSESGLKGSGGAFSGRESDDSGHPGCMVGTATVDPNRTSRGISRLLIAGANGVAVPLSCKNLAHVQNEE
jgi:hypothetical protein